MIEIAVCDDERPSLERSSEQARSSAARLHLQADVVPYTRSDALLYDIIEDGAHFDLLLLDIEMPNVDGMDLAAQIKPHLPDAKIIFITSHAEYAIDAFELSVFRYVPKSDIDQRLPRALDDALRIIAVDADRTVKRRRVMVFSDERAFGNFTFLEYLSFVFRAYRTPLADCSRIVRGFGFERYVETPLRELSLGSRKKASLIAAFALSPDLLILDEPVNGLDFESTEYLYRLIRDYREHGSVLFSSHVLESVCLTCDRVLVLERTDGTGRIRKTFSGEEISPASIRSALGHDEL